MTSWLKNKAHKKGEQKHLFMHFSTLPCPSLLAVGYLLIGRLLVQSPAAPVSIPTILEQDAKLLSDRQVCFVWLQREIRVISPTKSSLWMFVFVCGSNFTRLTHFLVWEMLEVEKWESCYLHWSMWVVLYISMGQKAWDSSPFKQRLSSVVKNKRSRLLQQYFVCHSQQSV